MKNKMEKEFFIDSENKIVTCSMYLLKENRTFEESAICSDSDKFNEEIGKEISELKTEIAILKYRNKKAKKEMKNIKDNILSLYKDLKYYTKLYYNTKKSIVKKYKLINKYF